MWNMDHGHQERGLRRDRSVDTVDFFLSGGEKWTQSFFFKKRGKK